MQPPPDVGTNRTMNFDHQRVIFDPNLARPVTLIGAGSVGGDVAVKLAQVGVTNLAVWDHDDVASHNIPMSVYRVGDLGRYKVDALTQIVRDKTGIEIRAIRCAWRGEPLRDSVVCCVDSMDVRLEIWKRVRNNPLIDFFIDTRIAQEFVAVYTINPTDPEQVAFYESRLYPSNEAKTPTCGEHGITYVSSVAASAAVARLTNCWKGDKTPTLFEMLVGSLRQIT